jgi:hypothetical protein
LISERLFNTLPMEERVYWHSHHFEVAVSGTRREQCQQPPQIEQ